MDKKDRFDVYIEIIIGKRKGTAKQLEVVEKMRYAFNLSCEGYTPLQIARILSEKYEMSQSRGFKLIQDCKKVFGDAAKFSKQGDRYAMYEYLMRLSKKAEQSGDFTTARNCAMDAAKMLGLDQPDYDGLINPMDFLNPDLFHITDNPKLINLVERTLEMTLDVEHELVENQQLDGKTEEDRSNTVSQ